MGVSLLDPDDSEVLCDAGASGMVRVYLYLYNV